jgi:hypothetical protein
MKISEKLKDLPVCLISDINDLQGNLKDLSEKDYEKLKGSIEKYGFIVPFFVWIDSKGKRWSLDGHQRKRVIEKAFGNIEVPYQEIEAANKKEAKQKILLISSQYGKVTKDGFDEFAFDLETDFVADFTTFDNWLDFEIQQFSDKNKEINTDDFSDKMTMKFELSEEEYQFVQSELSKLNANKEMALLKLLKYE